MSFKEQSKPTRVVHCLDLEGQQVQQAERMLKDDQIFHSLAYKWRGEICSYIAQFKENGYIEVEGWRMVKSETPQDAETLV